ncbi:MAG: pantoate--beta-alanine ligase [Dehalococcoidia bacterium]|nr:pantoate--beta-alanine ligase [Dehalococcoidia bacterium]
MQVARTVQECRALRAAMPGVVGLTPTMGALHEGHRSLMRRAREECDSVIATIFVNPTQFAPGEDYTAYPRREQEDLAICEAEGVDLVFMPPVEEMYPEGATTTVSVGELSTILEGASRPGHFDGVATIVTKLFAITRPDRGYFGQKDAQQLMVIRRLARDLQLGVEVIGCPIIREEGGLALSSRNVYLTDEERTQALAISRGLRKAEAGWLGGLRDASALRGMVHEEIAAQPLARIDYVSLADAESLAECDGRVTRDALLSVAARFGKARLIDNTVLRIPAGLGQG